MPELSDIHKILGDSGMKIISKEIFEKAAAQQQKLIYIKNRASNLLLLASTILFLSSSALSFCAVIYARGILPKETNEVEPIIDQYGTKRWWLNGKLHRLDGPAIELADGTKYWYLNGDLHREGGPAIEYSDGVKRWYLNGVRQK